MRRSFVSILVGLVLASLAVFLVTKYKGVDTLSSKNDGSMVNIIVAARDMPFGSDVIRDYLQYAAWPASSVPKGAFTNMDELVLDKEHKGNRMILHTTYAGEPILPQKVSGFGEKATLSRKVTEEKRAFSVRVNDVSGVAGFLTPGDRVDIMLTRAPDDGGKNLVTDVILQNIVILGVDQLTDESSEKPVLARTVTMEVSTDQAQKLALAQQVGTLSLTLRNYADNENTQAGRVSAADLILNVPNDIPAPPGVEEMEKVVVETNSVDNAIRVRRGLDVE